MAHDLSGVHRGGPIEEWASRNFGLRKLGRLLQNVVEWAAPQSRLSKAYAQAEATAKEFKGKLAEFEKQNPTNLNLADTANLKGRITEAKEELRTKMEHLPNPVKANSALSGPHASLKAAETKLAFLELVADLEAKMKEASDSLKPGINVTDFRIIINDYGIAKIKVENFLSKENGIISTEERKQLERILVDMNDDLKSIYGALLINYKVGEASKDISGYESTKTDLQLFREAIKNFPNNEKLEARLQELSNDNDYMFYTRGDAQRAENYKFLQDLPTVIANIKKVIQDATTLVEEAPFTLDDQGGLVFGEAVKKPFIDKRTLGNISVVIDENLIPTLNRINQLPAGDPLKGIVDLEAMVLELGELKKQIES